MASDKYQKLQQLDAQGKIDLQNVAQPLPANFKDKSILVTGGASGLGEACVRMFVAAGAYVVIADFDKDRGQALEEELGRRSKFIHVDVLSYHSQLLLFSSALQFFPNKRLDTVITFAGLQSQDWSMTPVPNGAEELFAYAKASSDNCASPRSSSPARPTIHPPSTKCLDVALHGSLYSMQIAIKYAMGLDQATKTSPSQAANLSRCIILVSSTAGFRNLENRPDYTAAKFGVRGVMRSLRSSLPHITESQGVRINLLAPSFVLTPMTKRLMPALEKAGVKIGKMEDVTRAVALMTADGRMNGRAISVTAEGIRDLCDDTAGEEGGREISSLMRDDWLSSGVSATIE